MAIELDAQTGNDDRRRVILPARYMMAIMGSLGVAISSGLNANFSVAIIAMVNHTAIRSDITVNISEDSISVCNYGALSEVNGTILENVGAGASIRTTAWDAACQDGPFVWDESMQGLILASYYWGNVISQVPGGRVAELFSAKWVANAAIMLNILCCLLSPWAARLHYAFLIALRLGQGLGGGVIYPSMHVLIAKWAPPVERNVISSITYSGSSLGIVVFMGISGILAGRFGWDSIFYIEGTISIIWCVAWWLLIQDSPEEQTILITEHEKNYIAHSQKQLESQTSKEKLPVPWGKVFRSLPLWAILISQCSTSFGWYMLLSESPTYMNQILKFDRDQSAGFSALPYLCMWLFTIILGKSLATFQSKGWISMIMSRKIAVVIASFIPMCCFIGITYVECNRTASVVILSIAIICKAGIFSGSLVNHIDIAPNFAGTLMAITSTCAQVPGFIIPIFVGAITHGNQTIVAWRTIFLVTAGIYVIDLCVYLTFGTTKIQPWNETTKFPPAQIEDPRSVPCEN